VELSLGCSVLRFVYQPLKTSELHSTPPLGAAAVAPDRCQFIHIYNYGGLGFNYHLPVLRSDKVTSNLFWCSRGHRKVREGAARIPRLTAGEQPNLGLVMTCCCQDPSACFIVPQRLAVSTLCHYFLFFFFIPSSKFLLNVFVRLLLTGVFLNQYKCLHVFLHVL
jgi:hypothetical protein